MEKETPKTPASLGRLIHDARVSLLEVCGFEDLIGQSDGVERLKRFGELYSAKNQVPEHVLLAGNGDRGKRVFARAFAKAFNTALHEVDAKELWKKGDLTAILTSLEEGDAFLILNVQDLRKHILEVL